MSETELETVYSLDIRVPEHPPHRVVVETKVTVGSDPNCEVFVEEYNLAPNQCVFRVHNEVLSIHNFGGEQPTLLAGHPLAQGKMYVLDKGDKIQMGELEILIRKDHIDPNQEVERPQGLTKILEITKKDIPIKVEVEVEEEVPHVRMENEPPPKQRKKKMVKATGAPQRLNTPKQGSKKKVAKKKVVKKKGVAKSFAPHVPAPSFVVRLYAFITQALMAYTIVFGVFPALTIEIDLAFLSGLLAKIIPQDLLSLVGPLLSSEVLTFLIVMLLSDMFFHFILGVSLPQFLAGIQASGNFLLARIKAPLRCLLGYLLMPFLIFDLPALLGKRTLKEVLTATALEQRSRAMAFLAVCVFFPAISAISLSSPLLLDSAHVGKAKVEAISTVQKTPLFDQNESFYSKYFSLSGINDKKNFVALPYFQKQKADGKLAASMRFYSPTQDYWVEIKKGPELPRAYFLSLLTQYNPIFEYMHPDIYSALQGRGGDPSILLNPFLFQSVQLALGFDYQSLPQVLATHGPFFQGLIQLRKEFLKALEIPPRINVSLIKLEGSDILWVREVAKANYLYDYFIPFEGKSLSGLELRYNKESKNHAQQFMRQVLLHSNLTPKKAQAEHPFSFFSLIDLINNKEAPLENTPEELIELYKEIQASPNQALLKAMGQSLQGLVRYGEEKSLYSFTKGLAPLLEESMKTPPESSESLDSAPDSQ